MYSFQKGSVLVPESLPDIYESGGKVMSTLQKNVYFLCGTPLDPYAMTYQDLELKFINQGIVPIHMSTTGDTALPITWQDSDPTYYLYQLLPNSEQSNVRTVTITPANTMYEMEGIYGLTNGFAWTNGHGVIKQVPLRADKNASYKSIVLQFINSGHYPPNVALDLGIGINGEVICSYKGSGKSEFSFPECTIPKKYYGLDVDISLVSNTWVPKELWPETSTDGNTLGVDFKELTIEFTLN
jgi:hypothetical protein